MSPNPQLHGRSSVPARRLRVVAVAGLALSMLGITSCLPTAKAGTRCRGTGFAAEGGWMLYCAGGKWARGMSVQQALELVDLSQRPEPQMQGAPIRVLVAGDSTGNVFGRALGRYGMRHPQIIQTVDVGAPGCPITRLEAIRNYDGEPPQPTERCTHWPTDLPQQVASFLPDVSLVFDSMMEQSDQRRSAAEGWRNVLDGEWAAFQRTNYTAFADILSSTGGAILWADVPVMRFWLRTRPWLADAPERTAALNASYHQLDVERPDVEILRFAERVERPRGTIDWFMRPDGIHLSDAAADLEVANWLVPLLIERYRKPVEATPAG